jgi:heme-degrading monooxygenase HmoA
VVSSTYGQPVPGPNGAFETQHSVDTFAAIQAQLEQQPGLVAFTLASSDPCGSGRTLAVWQSEDQMYDFVTSPAHLAAMNDVKQLLLPTYAVTHWSARSAEQITWAEAARQLSRVDAH